MTTDYSKMTEEELRDLQQKKNKELNTLRSKQGKGEEIKALRQEVLAIQAAGDEKQQERYAEYERIASEGLSTEVAGEAAAAVSEAERITGG